MPAKEMKMRFLGVFIAAVIVEYAHSSPGCENINKLAVNGIYINTPSWKSCAEIKNNNKEAVSGVYTIETGCGTKLEVYCEMTLGGGGFTFLPRGLTRMKDAKQIVDSLFTDKKNVLLKLMHRTQKQEYYTLIQPHSSWRNQDFGIRVNDFSDYTIPKNNFMKDYFFLGIIPKHLAAKPQNRLQGFVSNHRTIQFSNCDRNPNSLFAFLPNHNQQTPLGYHSSNLVYERSGVAFDWRKTAKPIHNPPRTMPNEFFFLTELHFGGCGTYSSSDRWRSFQATAIGIR
ncbi:uncharacterized protein LOC114954375 isoform X3 [Acropora millepora]|uniref:uncharacterized protein LOC114954375 isoform X3 n=1 Tax=Acropora millepora TaxID=45264 RepID=UPI001CF1E033|nr:uncharacterized protein LOC114954375 isoform X3 [Acropora millepora]XP_044179939.1 uncharacterized protein LOC114954375 isoform X3 [Acropora millepora]